MLGVGRPAAGIDADVREAGTGSFGDGGAVCRAGWRGRAVTAGMMDACTAEAEASGAGVVALTLPIPEPGVWGFAWGGAAAAVFGRDVAAAICAAAGDAAKAGLTAADVGGRFARLISFACSRFACAESACKLVDRY